VALVTLGGLLAGVNMLAIVLAALLAGAVLLRPAETGRPRAAARSSPDTEARPLRRWLSIALAAGGVVAVAGLSALLHTAAGHMALSMFQVGSLAFGNGMTILPLLQAQLVTAHQWLTPHQFADGVALGQVTPGPFLITAAFAGYKVGGLAGAALMTFAIFSPSIVMTMACTEILTRLTQLAAIHGALAGVLAAFVSLLMVVLLQLGTTVLGGPASLLVAAGAFVAVRFFALDLP